MSDNLIVSAVGPTGSGKSLALWDLFVVQQPRKLSIDFKAEVRSKLDPQAIDVYSYRECIEALQDLAVVGQWHVTYVADADDRESLVKLAKLLTPTITQRDQISYPRAIGGLMLICHEADLLLPNQRTEAPMRGMFQRGRHDKLSLAMATQFPAAVHPAVRTNSHYFLAFGTQETTVFKYWQSVTSTAVAERIASLGQYECCYIVKSEQRVYVLDRQRHVTQTLDYRSVEIGRPAPTPTESAEIEPSGSLAN